MTRQFRVELRGDQARLGVVPAADVAHLLLAVERALARQSAHAIGRPAAGTGRWESVIANAARIRLAGIEEGSIIPVLELPDYGVDGLALEAETLGEAALEDLLDFLSGDREPERDVATVFVEAADELGIGSRYESIVFDRENGQGRRRVVVNSSTRDRLRSIAVSPPTHRQAAVRGTLVEADFERWSARLRTLTGDSVSVLFAPELADDVDRVLRRPAELEGHVSFDPVTNVAVSIRVQEIHPQAELWPTVQSGEYWRDQSLAEAQRLGIASPVHSIAELRAIGPSDGADLDAFLAVLAE